MDTWTGLLWSSVVPLPELLVSRGMSGTLVDDLATALAQFEKTLEATRAGRRDHVGASADLQAVITEITEEVRVLDGLVRYRFSDNAELMGAWASARDVLGPFRSRSEPPTQPTNEGQTPAGPDAVKSARDGAGAVGGSLPAAPLDGPAVRLLRRCFQNRIVRHFGPKHAVAIECEPVVREGIG